MSTETGTPENPWARQTPPRSSAYTMHRAVKDGREILVCTVGRTTLHSDYRALHDLHVLLKAPGDWMDLGSTDEQKPAQPGTVEAWGRADDTPWAAGPGYGRAAGAASACTSRRCWKSWTWPS